MCSLDQKPAKSLAMIGTLKLLFPALIPSWRFFDTVTSSPRIEYAILQSGEDHPAQWQEFRARPDHLPIRIMIKRMIWNPQWNETLYLSTCADRLIDNQSPDHFAQEIAKRIKTALMKKTPVKKIPIKEMPEIETAAFFQFRILVLKPEGETISRDIMYVSKTYNLEKDAQ